MKFLYVISVVSLLISFLLFKKSDKRDSFISSLVYSLCLLFCYNTVIVSIIGLIGINGNLLKYSEKDALLYNLDRTMAFPSDVISNKTRKRSL